MITAPGCGVTEQNCKCRHESYSSNLVRFMAKLWAWCLCRAVRKTNRLWFGCALTCLFSHGYSKHDKTMDTVSRNLGFVFFKPLPQSYSIVLDTLKTSQWCVIMPHNEFYPLSDISWSCSVLKLDSFLWYLKLSVISTGGRGERVTRFFLVEKLSAPYS